MVDSSSNKRSLRIMSDQGHVTPVSPNYTELVD